MLAQLTRGGHICLFGVRWLSSAWVTATGESGFVSFQGLLIICLCVFKDSFSQCFVDKKTMDARKQENVQAMNIAEKSACNIQFNGLQIITAVFTAPEKN